MLIQLLFIDDNIVYRLKKSSITAYSNWNMNISQSGRREIYQCNPVMFEPN